MKPEDADLDQLFASMDVPLPDPERKKETLNLAVAEFEAQKSAISEKNQKTGQGLSWLARLIRQATPERKDTMDTKNRKYIYRGLIGGLATACVALLIYQPSFPKTGADGVPPADQVIALNEVNQAPGSSEFSATMSEAIQDKNVENVEEAARQSGSAMPVPIMPSKGALPLPRAEKGKMESLAAGAMPAAPAANMVMSSDAFAPVMDSVQGRDRFSHEEQNSIKVVKQEPVSTFSIDVDTASYSFARQSLDQGVLPQKDSVRIEEMVNYFDYAYPAPGDAQEPFKANVSVKDSPWNKGKKLMTIGIKGYDVEKTAQPDSNLVFLIDTSGSMNDPKKLPLLKQSLGMLLDTLKPTDKVSIVVYAGSAGTVLQPTEVSKKREILQALQNLEAGGSTAGGEGIRLAYQQAQANFNPKAVNRVILATDGDFNVGITEPEEFKGFVEREREKGIFLSVIGFGQGNYNDALMQELAQNGNGVASYIDTLNEARKVLVQEASAALFPIAKDVKIQVEFNPQTVSEYRLVGYETRALKTEDFNNDKVDAGDIGAGAEVTAIYEVTPVGGPAAVDPSRYVQPPAENAGAKDKELAFVKIRYKLPAENTSKLITTPVTAKNETPDPVVVRETGWAEAVAGFAQLLKGGTYTGNLTYDDVLKQAQENKGDDPFGYRAEFINLVYKAKTAASLPQPINGNGVGEEYPVPVYQ